jgi:hypothetical protein
MEHGKVRLSRVTDPQQAVPSPCQVSCMQFFANGMLCISICP